jgi:hypothetical protein
LSVVRVIALLSARRSTLMATIDHIILNVNEIAASVDFYVNVHRPYWSPAKQLLTKPNSGL